MKKCMETDKKIQILLSTYNGEKYLREQLDSFVKQESFNENIKVLIRDDGSTDGTIIILDEYKEKYGFEVIYGSNIGVNKSLFQLFEYRDKTCDFYAFSDQDDVWVDTKFKKAIMALSGYEESIPLLYSSLSCITNKDLEPTGTSIVPAKGVSFFNAMVQNVTPGHTQVFNRKLMDLMVEKQAEYIHVIDWWVYLIASGTGRVVFDNDFTVLHRQHGNNAVGYEKNSVKLALKRIKRAFSAEGNSVSKQLKAFKKSYFNNLNKEYQHEISMYFDCQKSIFIRIKYVINTKVYRQTTFETVVFKCLYILGKYNV